MFKGVSTLEAYEKCISIGLCDKHFIDFGKESSIEERHELQRKAFLYIRLRILDPLLFGKTFIFEKMEALISKSDYFSSRSSNQEKNDGNNFIDNILLLDSIVVFTLCHFCKICCCGCLFQSNQTIQLGLDQESAFIQKLLSSKNVTENDIRHFNPVLQENFIGYDKSLIKFCYVVALLFVRNTTIKVRLKQALTELTSELQYSSVERKRWLEIAKEAELKKNYEESLEAVTSALNYNPYCYRARAVRGTVYIQMKKYKKAQLDSYISTMINPQNFIGYGNLCIHLIHEKLLQDCFMLLKYAAKKCQLKEYQDFLELEKILDKQKMFDNIAQFTNFEEMFLKHYENLTNEDWEENFTKEASKKKLSKDNKDVKTKNHLENGFKYSFSKIEDVPDLEEAQDSEEEASLPDLSDASKSSEGSDNENTKRTIISNKKTACVKENSASETKLSGAEAKKSETSVFENKKFETKSPEAKKFVTKSSESIVKKMEANFAESSVKKIETKSVESEDRKWETKLSKSNSLSLLKENLTKQQLNELLKEGSQMVLDGCGYLVVNQFVSAMETINTTMKSSDYEECEIVCIKYACGLAYCSSGSYEDLLKSIEIFKQIIECHSNVTFPSAYYGIGLAFHKLNRFKDALKYLKTVNDILEKGICFKAYTWPGLKTVISETKFEQLKALVSCKIKECELPPPPDAICRYEECSTQTAIYYSDPDFKGFLDLQCSDHCILQYHAVCWKALKTSINLTDKEFLEKTCLTPDCNGIVIKVEIVNKEGAVDKVFRSAQEKKCVKSKKPKPPKRMDSKEEKRKRRHPHRESESEKTSDEIDPKEFHQSELASCEKEKCAAIPLSVNAEPFIVIRKEKLSNENVSKTPAKSKELKKSKPVTISFNEFCKDSNAYSQSQLIPTYQQGENYSYTPEEWPSCNEASSSHLPPPHDDQVTPSELDLLEIDDFDAIKNNLYNYLEEYLTRNGPLSVKDARLVRELENFPTEANVVIAKYGGITEFLKNDIEYRFGIVDDSFICSRNDLAEAYKLSRSVIGTDLLEEYDRVHCPSHIGPTLNPDAQEYRPSSSSIASSSTNSLPEEEIPSDVIKTEPSPLSSSSIMSAISKLRQPLAVDDGKAFLQDHSSSSVQDAKSLAEKCIGAVKLYFSDDMDSQRAYIDACIKPFRIASSPNKSNVALQTEETVMVKTESKGTSTTNNEVNDLNKLVQRLTEEKRELEIQKTLIETKLTTEMDAAAKCNKKALVEIECLKKELEDSNLALQSLKIDYKKKEMKLEREHEALMESLNKSAELNDVQEKEINIWCSKNQSLQEKLKKMEECIEDLKKENDSLKKSFDQQLEKYNSSVQNAESEKLQLMKRAKCAEVQFLQFRKEVLLSKIDNKAKEAKSRMKEIEDFLPMVNSNPLYKKNLEILHTNINNYFKKLAEIRLDLQTRCDEQTNAVNNGAPLQFLIPVEAKELPEIPCFTTQFPANPSMAMAAQLMFTGAPTDNMHDSMATQSMPPSNASSPPAVPAESFAVPPAVLSVAGVSNKSCDNLSLELDYKGKQDSEKTASTFSLASSQGSAKALSAGKSCDKLLTKLRSKYPEYDGSQLMFFIKEFRKNRKGGLSGLTIESIISGVSTLIESQPKQEPPPKVPEMRSKAPQNRLVNKKLVEQKDPRLSPPPEQKACPWGPSKSGEKNNWSGSGLEEGCIICYEEMTTSNAYKVDCGHCFHLKCIREWLNKKSDCPICRVHLLLPEDYPALS